jgi:hypothetical protein
LYLCDDGIKLFDANKPMDLQLKSNSKYLCIRCHLYGRFEINLNISRK